MGLLSPASPSPSRSILANTRARARVSRKLRDLDKVAYVRFASVYREFEDLDDMLEEIENVRDTAGEAPGQQQLFPPRPPA